MNKHLRTSYNNPTRTRYEPRPIGFRRWDNRYHDMEGVWVNYVLDTNNQIIVKATYPNAEMAIEGHEEGSLCFMPYTMEPADAIQWFYEQLNPEPEEETENLAHFRVLDWEDSQSKPICEIDAFMQIEGWMVHIDTSSAERRRCVKCIDTMNLRDQLARRDVPEGDDTDE